MTLRLLRSTVSNDDRADVGARHNLVYCYPLLDRRILEFALGLPPEQFRRGKWNRWLMRNAVSKILPSEVCWNPDKSDPIRVGGLSTVSVEALNLVGPRLAKQSEMRSQAVYLDMPRLMQQLTPEALAARDRGWGKLINAVQFLDW